MDFLIGWIAPPRADHVLIAKYIIVIISIFFVAYIGVLFGTTFFSLGFSARGESEKNPLFTRLSKDLVDTLYGNVGAALILGVLPVITLAICFAHLLYGTSIKLGQYFSFLLVFTVLGLIVARLYKSSFNKKDAATLLHYGLGAVTLVLLAHVLFSFASIMSVVLFPEEWPVNREIIPVLYDWNVIARVSFLVTSSLALTGGAILFFFFNWMGGKADLNKEYAEYARKFGSGVALGFAIVQAPFFLWVLGTLPYPAKSYSLYWSALGALFLLFMISYLLYTSLRDASVRHGSWIFIFFMLFLVVLFVKDNIARENALVYQNYALEKVNQEIHNEIEMQRLERGGVAEASVEMGEQIYNQKCIACHRFDQRLVGPPYNEVLPRYEDNSEALKNFILNPVQVNPEYPAMPNQGLKPIEAESAAKYLLQKYEEASGQQ
jgi:cytochrome c